MNYNYQWEYLSDHRSPVADIRGWQRSYGPIVVERDGVGRSSRVRFQLLLDNREVDAYLIGEINGWERDLQKLGDFKLEADSRSVQACLELSGVEHKMEYKFLLHHRDSGEVQILGDPAALYFADGGNSVFWDFEDPASYQMQHPLVGSFDRSTRILQTDLPGLIVHFADQAGVCGKDVPAHGYYRFVTESGVIARIRELGFNGIQFLPFAQAIDGDNWKLRYLVPFQYAIQKNWGSPDDFARMVDEFHRYSIAVIGDLVLGHLPDRDFRIFGQSDREHGIHLWKKSDGTRLYMNDETPWGSSRIDFDNPHVRRFFVESALHFMKAYRVDGFRIDNIDGILRYGHAGEGEERLNGRTFLRELATAIYSFNPAAMLHYEAHYYHGDNAKMLVAPLASDSRALGATAYTSSRLTYYFHTKYMLLSSENNSIWPIKHIVDEQEWGKSDATVADFHNHDAAAGLMEMRCTGSYAYDAMLALNEQAHIHALGKIKAMESVISFGCDGRTLDLMQTFLLQMGTFEHDSSIQWYLTFNEISFACVRFKQRVNQIMEDPAFWPANTRRRQYLNVDDRNKVLVIERSSERSSFVAVINLSEWKLHSYRVGLKNDRNMCVVFNSDEMQYGGFGMTHYPGPLINQPSSNFELLNREVEIPVLPPYATIVLQSKGG